MARSPFQSRLALVHTARTHGPCPGLPSQEPADLTNRRPWALARFVSGSVFEGAQRFIAGWSSPVARQAHNLKVIGSNPIPATKTRAGRSASSKAALRGGFRVCVLQRSLPPEVASLYRNFPLAINGTD